MSEMRRIEQMQQTDGLARTKKKLFEAIHKGLAYAYPEIGALEREFNEFQLYSFMTMGSRSQDYAAFENIQRNSARGLNITRNRPMHARYMAIAHKGEYQRGVSAQLAKNGILKQDDILGGGKIRASASENGMSYERILLGLGNDSLVVDLRVFPSELKSPELVHIHKVFQD